MLVKYRRQFAEVDQWCEHYSGSGQLPFYGVGRGIWLIAVAALAHPEHFYST